MRKKLTAMACSLERVVRGRPRKVARRTHSADCSNSPAVRRESSDARWEDSSVRWEGPGAR